MDVTQLLIASQQPDPNVRQPATQQLEEFKNKNLPMYLVSMAQLVADDQKPPPLRQAACLQIKNTVSGRSKESQDECNARWLALDPNGRKQIKKAIIAGLSSGERVVRRAASQAVAGIALVEIPAGQWQDCIGNLAGAVGSDNNNMREASLMSLGYICEKIEPEVLGAKTNDILGAVITAMNPGEKCVAVRVAAIKALLEMAVFIEGNMQQENERNAIVQTVCANVINEELEVRLTSMQVLVELARLYYGALPKYIQHLFTITLKAIKTDHDSVAQQGIEFWATICEVELELEEEEEVGVANEASLHFVKGSLPYLVPILLETLTKQDEDPESEEWNGHKAAGCCLRLVSSLTRDAVVPPVMGFVTSNISNPNWRFRDAAVLAFGCILDGPSQQCLAPLINQALPILVRHMSDQEQIVRDTTAWTIGAVCELHPGLVSDHLHSLMVVLVDHLNEAPAVASQVCYAVHYLALALEEHKDMKTSPLSKYFQGVVKKLMACTERNDLDESNLRAAVYEALNSLIKAAAQDQMGPISTLVGVFIDKLDKSFEMQDVNAAADLQALICGVLLAITDRLGPQVQNVSDQMMTRYLKVFATPVPRVHEEALLAIGGLANALGKNFTRYASTPYLQRVLVKALETTEDAHVCSVAVSLVSDISIALEHDMLPMCDTIMTVLLRNLNNPNLDRDVQPGILSCFGDIAMAIGGDFGKYLGVTMNMLSQASQVKVGEYSDLDYIDYVDELREAILEAYSSIFQHVPKENPIIQASMNGVIQFLVFLTKQNLPDGVIRAGVNLIGDIASSVGKQWVSGNHQLRAWVQVHVNSKNEQIRGDANWAMSIMK